MIYTTLNKIRACGPCEDGWRKLLKWLGKTEADDEPLPFATIVESNGIEDALWCCRVAPEHDHKWRLFAVWCARQVQHLMTDQRSIAALDVAERYANGKATREELDAAWDAAACAAAGETSWEVAWDAPRETVCTAARKAACAAAGEASWEASWDAPRETVCTAAGKAACAAAGEAAACAAAGETSWEASWDAAWEVACDAARAAQTKKFLEIVS